MILAPIPINDLYRVKGLLDLDILDSNEEDEFNDIVLLASKICNTPISLISLVDYSRQWFKAKIGVSETETARDISFCGHAIVQDNDFFEVPDALKDIRFSDNPLVLSEPNIRFYAGVQLISKKGYRIGMLCVNDTKPNKLNEEQILALKVLGNHVAKMLDLRITKKQSEIKSRKIESQNELLKRMMSIIAHDVRGPISSLQNIFELSDAKILDEDSKKQLLQMSKFQVENILTLLNNLVEWGIIQMDEKVKGIQKVKIKDIVEKEIGYLDSKSILKGNKMINLVSNDLEIPFEMDMLQFLVRNLLTNANKFTSNGKIMVYSDKQDGYIKITIKDEGVGMSQQTIETLLQKNTIFSTLGTDNEKGSGLGFKLIKEFIDNIGGSISIQSKEGNGTSVCLGFPEN